MEQFMYGIPLATKKFVNLDSDIVMSLPDSNVPVLSLLYDEIE